MKGQDNFGWAVDLYNRPSSRVGHFSSWEMFGFEIRDRPEHLELDCQSI